MEGSVHQLPPSKRFKLLHYQQSSSLCSDGIPSNPECLPAKKRRSQTTTTSLCLPAKKRCSHATATSLCLPAKKRVWAPPPLFPEDLAASEEEQDEKPKKQLRREDEAQERERVDEEAAAEEDDGVLCAVCRSTDGDPLDPIVFCDGCDLMVHATCYGNPLVKSIPEGDWFCLSCERKADGVRNCCLCPVKGGALKPTTDQRWAHVACALLVPEVFFCDPEGRDGIDCSKVPSHRWRKSCYLCGRKNSGCAIECSEPKCELGFHVSCGLQEDLSIEYKEGRRGAVVAGFCADHTELWKKQQQTGKFKIVARDHEQKRKARG